MVSWRMRAEDHPAFRVYTEGCAPATLDAPIFAWGEGAYQAVELVMLCGDGNRAHLFAKESEQDGYAMVEDLLRQRDQWRARPDEWVDAVTDGGAPIKERPQAYRWWPKDRIT
jgi:hypothetical protein